MLLTFYGLIILCLFYDYPCCRIVQLLDDGCEGAQRRKSRKDSDVYGGLVEIDDVAIDLQVHRSPKLMSKSTSRKQRVKHMTEYTRTPTEAPTAPLGIPPDISTYSQLFFLYKKKKENSNRD